MCMKQMRNKVSVIRIYERVKYWFSFFYSDKKRKIYVVTSDVHKDGFCIRVVSEYWDLQFDFKLFYILHKLIAKGGDLI